MPGDPPRAQPTLSSAPPPRLHERARAQAMFLAGALETLDRWGLGMALSFLGAKTAEDAGIGRLLASEPLLREARAPPRFPRFARQAAQHATNAAQSAPCFPKRRAMVSEQRVVCTLRL
jgi:hypothetical protein